MKIQINGLTIEFANRMAIFNCYAGLSLPYSDREFSTEIFTIACLAFPKYDRVIMLEKTNKLGGASKLSVYVAFEFYGMKKLESVFNRKKEIKKFCKDKSHSLGYYYEPLTYDRLQELSLDFGLNHDVELVEDGERIIINPHEIIIKFLRKYKLEKLNENSKG